MRVPVEAKRAEAARKVLAKKLNDVIFSGISTRGCDGLLNNASVSLVTSGLTGTWSGATASQIVSDIQTLEMTVFNDSKGVEQPDTLLLPCRCIGCFPSRLATTWTKLCSDFDAAWNACFRQKYQWAYDLETADAGGTGPRAVIYRRDSEAVEALVAIEFVTHPTMQKSRGSLPARRARAAWCFTTPEVHATATCWDSQMALTASTFKQRWPEFEATSDARVTTALAVATTQVNAATFTGDRFDHAVGLLAAHGLSVSPFGRPAKAKESGRSAYLEEFERLARALCRPVARVSSATTVLCRAPRPATRNSERVSETARFVRAIRGTWEAPAKQPRGPRNARFQRRGRGACASHCRRRLQEAYASSVSGKSWSLAIARRA